jgi:hypothetical protein
MGLDTDRDSARRCDDGRSDREDRGSLEKDPRAGNGVAEDHLEAPVGILRRPAPDLGDGKTGEQELREPEPDESKK